MNLKPEESLLHALCVFGAKKVPHKAKQLQTLLVCLMIKYPPETCVQYYHGVLILSYM